MSKNSKQLLFERMRTIGGMPLREEESERNNVNINIREFPEDIKKTLDEYQHIYIPKYDWNTKADEFGGSGTPEFRNWLKDHENQGFIENIDKLIQAVRQDYILKLRQRNSQKVLDDFEDLIKPALGNSALSEPLSEYLKFAFMNINDIDELQDAFEKAKDVIDPDGSINTAKITPSDFGGGELTIPSFSNFVKKNPEYRGVYEDWEKLVHYNTDLMLKDLNAFRNSVSLENLKQLYNFLLDIRKKIKG